MVFFYLQAWFGHLWFARASYSKCSGSKPGSKYKPGTKSKPVVLVFIIIFHVALIFVALNATIKQRETSVTPSLLKMIYLPQEKTQVKAELHIAVIEPVTINVPVVVLEVIVDEQSALTITRESPKSDYQLSNPNDAKYRDVFDPKMRQRLIDAELFNKPRTAEKPESWTESDGRVFSYMGDGRCLVSMPNADWRDRGKNWGGTSCGKTDSEKMMDRVMEDFESRKNPLKMQ